MVAGLAVLLGGVGTYFSPHLLPWSWLMGDWIQPDSVQVMTGVAVAGGCASLYSLDGSALQVSPVSQGLGEGFEIDICFLLDQRVTGLRFYLHGWWKDPVPADPKIKFEVWLWRDVVQGWGMVQVGESSFASQRMMFASQVFNNPAETSVTVILTWWNQWSYHVHSFFLDQAYLEVISVGTQTQTSTSMSSQTTGATTIYIQGPVVTATVTRTVTFSQLVTTTVGSVVSTKTVAVTQTQTKTVQVGTATVIQTITSFGQTVLKTMTTTYTVEKPAKAGKIDVSWALIAVGLAVFSSGAVLSLVKRPKSKRGGKK
jgi:hypothetical protein